MMDLGSKQWLPEPWSGREEKTDDKTRGGRKYSFPFSDVRRLFSPLLAARRFILLLPSLPAPMHHQSATLDGPSQRQSSPKPASPLSPSPSQTQPTQPDKRTLHNEFPHSHRLTIHGLVLYFPSEHLRILTIPSRLQTPIHPSHQATYSTPHYNQVATYSYLPWTREIYPGSSQVSLPNARSRRPPPPVPSPRPSYEGLFAQHLHPPSLPQHHLLPTTMNRYSHPVFTPSRPATHCISRQRVPLHPLPPQGISSSKKSSDRHKNFFIHHTQHRQHKAARSLASATGAAAVAAMTYSEPGHKRSLSCSGLSRIPHFLSLIGSKK
ncbi:hypothetical protein B0T18DRAFT_412082 [Schizothecium vesticola]|uniref:Uncharacterized protein n=1 Tax=Schizothecium vesticola TaxID=314040 RepID=A0AA40EWL8_9PEZI|nr:hypothetical protein B0T18DRAFT_412082 [Schizothecium vesticola]